MGIETIFLTLRKRSCKSALQLTGYRVTSRVWNSSLKSPSVGFEPTTNKLTVYCSTAELTRNISTRWDLNLYLSNYEFGALTIKLLVEFITWMSIFVIIYIFKYFNIIHAS